MRYSVTFLFIAFALGCASSKSGSRDYTTNPSREARPYDRSKTRNAMAASEGTNEANAEIPDIYAEARSSDGSSASGLHPTRHEVLEMAEALIGSPYRYGGTSPKAGFDCSGFTRYVYASQGIRLPRTSGDQANVGKRKPIAKAEKGDLIFFGTGSRVTHVGIITDHHADDIIMIHSSSSGGVRTDAVLTSPYWRSRVLWVTSPY